ncbi:MAG: hypothetical protein R2707_17515 [Acidimicrobiales bacterium]
MRCITTPRHSRITIDPAFNGPANSGHGGVCGGRFAELVDGARASVRFESPIPLDEPLAATRVGSTVRVVGSAGPVASVRTLAEPLRTGPFGRLSRADVAAAEAGWLDGRDGDHVAPTCFACGPERGDGTGLGLRPGPVPESSILATSWLPGVGCEVPHWMVWAALDCPTGLPALAAVGLDQAVVTAELSVEIRDRVRGDGDYQLVSRRTGGAGRKHFTEAALVDERGRLAAVATALWVTVPIHVMQPHRVLGAE